MKHIKLYYVIDPIDGDIYTRIFRLHYIGIHDEENHIIEYDRNYFKLTDKSWELLLKSITIIGG